MKFTHMPFVSSRKEYERCIAEVVAKARGNPTLLSLYRMGGEWTPGISDMDIVVVYKNGVVPQPLPGPYGLSPEADRIFTHRYLTFDEKDFEHFFYIYPSIATNITQVHGKPYMPNDPKGKAGYKELLATNLFDVFLNKLLHFPAHIAKKSQNARKLLLELYSLKYTSAILKELTGEAAGGEYIDRICVLRENWFDLQEEERLQELVTLLDEGVATVGEMFLCFSEYLKSKGGNNSSIFNNKSYKISFSDDWRWNRYVDRYKRSGVEIQIMGKKLSKVRLILPTPFLLFFEDHQPSGGMLSTLIAQAVTPALASGRNNLLIARRIEAMNNIFKRSFDNQGLYRIPFSYGFSMADINKPFAVSMSSLTLDALSAIKRLFGP